MATWPVLGELKQVLDVTSEDWDDMFDRVLAGAIEYVKVTTVGSVVTFDALYTEPTDRLSQAALRMAELVATRPDAADRPSMDPTLRRLLYGYRRKFGIA